MLDFEEKVVIWREDNDSSKANIPPLFVTGLAKDTLVADFITTCSLPISN
jgi:hypothetical protein